MQYLMGIDSEVATILDWVWVMALLYYGSKVHNESWSHLIL